MADHEFYEVFKTFTFECIMNEMNPRMRSKSPLQQWLVAFPIDLSRGWDVKEGFIV
jgi:hypothetical protein